IVMGPRHPARGAVAEQLAARLGLLHRALGAEKEACFRARGFDDAELRRRWAQGGCEAVHAYTRPFDLAALEQLLGEGPAAGVELDETLSIYEVPAAVARARAALGSYPHVVLVLPSLDVDRAGELLEAPHAAFIDGVEIEEPLVRHHSNRDLA